MRSTTHASRSAPIVATPDSFEESASTKQISANTYDDKKREPEWSAPTKARNVNAENTNTTNSGRAAYQITASWWPSAKAKNAAIRNARFQPIAGHSPKQKTATTFTMWRNRLLSLNAKGSTPKRSSVQCVNQ